jgi:predicted transposase/invertase (TIGR01784 family)
MAKAKDKDKQLLSPKLDVVFKALMTRDKELVKNFLKAATDLPKEEFYNVDFPDTHLLPDFPGLKMEIMDLRVTTKSGIETDIELQLLPHDGIRERFLLYLVRPFSLQLKKGKKEKSYLDLKKVILIVITDFVLLTEEKDCINRYFLQNQKSGNMFIDKP